MKRGMSPFAARRSTTDGSFASTCSLIGMPHHPSSFGSNRTHPDIGFLQYPSQSLGDLPDHFGALNVDGSTHTHPDIGFPQHPSQCIGYFPDQVFPSNVDAKTKTSSGSDIRLSPPQTIGGPSIKCDNVPSKINGVELDNISKPPGTFLVSSTCLAAPIANIHMMDRITGGCYPQQAAYQWLNSSTAYTSTTARGDHNDRHRTPRRQRCEQVAQDAQKEVNWEQRQEDRALALRNFKLTPEYIDNQDVDFRPTTPDPNAGKTKRPWEKQIAEWRGGYREIDAVRKLEKLGFREFDIIDAWHKAKDKMDRRRPHNQEAQLEEAKQILAKK